MSGFYIIFSIRNKPLKLFCEAIYNREAKVKVIGTEVSMKL